MDELVSTAVAVGGGDERTMAEAGPPYIPLVCLMIHGLQLWAMTMTTVKTGPKEPPASGLALPHVKRGSECAHRSTWYIRKGDTLSCHPLSRPRPGGFGQWVGPSDVSVTTPTVLRSGKLSPFQRYERF